MPLYALIVVVNMMLQSAGKALSASVVAAARQGMFLIPSILLLGALFDLTGLQFAQTTSDVLSFALALPLGLAFLKEMKKEIEKNEAD
jgi:Na+-driven multidrug efflux pump